MTEQQRWHFRAVRMLAGTTIFWSLSFPLVKAITILQSSLLPESSSWFHASLTGFVRFSVAGLVLLCMNFKTVRQLTRSEIWQGLGLGFFAGGGILLQMDALSYTSASPRPSLKVSKLKFARTATPRIVSPMARISRAPGSILSRNATTTGTITQ